MSLVPDISSAVDRSGSFDLVEELNEKQDELSGDAQIQLHRCPRYVDTSWRRIRRRISKPPKGASFAACISYGVTCLYSREPIKDYLNVVSDVEKDDDISSRAQVEIDRFRKSWTLY